MEVLEKAPPIHEHTYLMLVMELSKRKNEQRFYSMPIRSDEDIQREISYYIAKMKEKEELKGRKVIRASITIQIGVTL